MKRVFLFSLFWVFCLFSQAQMCVWRNGVLVFETPVSEIDSITFAKTNEAGVATWVLHVPPTTSMSVEISVVGNWGSEGGPEYWVPGAVLMERQEDGSYTLTKEVPAAFQYKYVMRANGGSWSWDNQYDQLYEMPLSLYAEDEILRWDDEFWNYLFYWEFSTSFGEFTTQDVLGSESWMIEFNTASMTGYAENTNNANEDWLISPAIALPQLPAVKLTLECIARYFADLANDITVYVSENYSGGSPSTAQWTKIEPASPLVSGADWITFSTTEYSLTPYVGKTIRFAIKYVSTDTKAGTIEVKSVAVEEGEASGSGDVEEPEIPTEVTGQGTKENPYTANDVIALNSTVIGPFYVKGYIEGRRVRTLTFEKGNKK